MYKWILRQTRGHETRAKWDRLTRGMCKEWVAQWGITKKAKERRRGERAVQEEVLDRGAREKGRQGILLCAPLGFKEPRGKVQSMRVECYDVHVDMFWQDNIPGGSGQGEQCSG